MDLGKRIEPGSNACILSEELVGYKYTEFQNYIFWKLVHTSKLYEIVPIRQLM
jgi:hypothetical protein